MTSQADQVAALNAAAMGEQSEWDEHGRLMFVMALEADERIAQLEAALRSIADMHTDADAAVPYSSGQTYFMRAHKIAMDALSNK